MVGAGFYGGRGVGTTLYSGFNPPMPRGQGTQSNIPAPQQGNPYPQTGGVPPADPGVVYPDLYVNAPGYDNSAAIRALYDSLKSKGRKIYRSTKRDLRGIYEDLEAAYAPRQESTRASYEGAINMTNAERESGDAAAALRSSAEDAARRDMMARMGIGNEADTGSGGGSVDMAREQGASTRGALQQNWSGLMGALSTAQQGRDASALLGVGDQRTMALEELSTRWSDYRQSLAEREAEAMKSARGGGGKMLNPEYQGLPELLKNAQIQQFANKTNQSVEDVIAQMGGNQSQGIDPGVAQFGLEAMANWSLGNQGKIPRDAYLAQQFKQQYGDQFVPYLQNYLQYDPYRSGSYSR